MVSVSGVGGEKCTRIYFKSDMNYYGRGIEGIQLALFLTPTYVEYPIEWIICGETDIRRDVTMDKDKVWGIMYVLLGAEPLQISQEQTGLLEME